MKAEYLYENKVCKGCLEQVLIRKASAYCAWCEYDRQRNQPLELLAEIMRYRRGKRPYDFSRMPTAERDLATLEGWEELETRIEALLEKEGVEL